MKILQVNTESTWRGGERQTLYTLQGLRERGVDADLLALSGSRMHQQAETNGFRVIPVTGHLDLLNKARSLKGRYTCIHAQSGKAHTQMVLTKPFHQLPVIYTRRVDFPPAGWVTRLKYRYTDEVVAISAKISEILQGSGMWNSAEVISSAVKDRELDVARALKVKRGICSNNDEVKVVGLISAVEPHKGPEVALKMARELRNQRSDFVVMHFGHGALFEEFSRKVESETLDPYYFLMGHYDNVEDFFSLFDVFVMTSKEEGLGSSVLDAFNYEVPVVSTAAGGLSALVNGRGEICPVDDYQCLALALDRALSLGDEIVDKMQVAKEYSDFNCSIGSMVDHYLPIYERFCK